MGVWIAAWKARPPPGMTQQRLGPDPGAQLALEQAQFNRSPVSPSCSRVIDGGREGAFPASTAGQDRAIRPAPVSVRTGRWPCVSMRTGGWPLRPSFALAPHLGHAGGQIPEPASAHGPGPNPAVILRHAGLAPLTGRPAAFQCCGDRGIGGVPRATSTCRRTGWLGWRPGHGESMSSVLIQPHLAAKITPARGASGSRRRANGSEQLAIRACFAGLEPIPPSDRLLRAPGRASGRSARPSLPGSPPPAARRQPRASSQRASQQAVTSS